MYNVNIYKYIRKHNVYIIQYSKCTNNKVRTKYLILIYEKTLVLIS